MSRILNRTWEMNNLNVVLTFLLLITSECSCDGHDGISSSSSNNYFEQTFDESEPFQKMSDFSFIPIQAGFVHFSSIKPKLLPIQVRRRKRSTLSPPTSLSSSPPPSSVAEDVCPSVSDWVAKVRKNRVIFHCIKYVFFIECVKSYFLFNVCQHSWHILHIHRNRAMPLIRMGMRWQLFKEFLLMELLSISTFMKHSVHLNWYMNMMTFLVPVTEGLKLLNPLNAKELMFL